MKWLLFLLLLLTIVVIALFIYRPETAAPTVFHPTDVIPLKSPTILESLRNKAQSTRLYLKQKGFSTHYIFLADMSLTSGRKRFFVYNLQKEKIVASGLMAHGSCNTRFLSSPQFSNLQGCGCSSLGRYKVGGKYEGRFGKAFKLLGLDSTNSNAYQRNVVLHAYDCVPDEETEPYPICNSLGCAMVSYKFLNTLSILIEHSEKPIMLWIYK